MDFNTIEPDNFQPDKKAPLNGFAKASMILGYIAIGSTILTGIFPCCVPVPVFAALLGIIFSFVSRNQTGRFTNQAIIGLVCSAVTFVFLILAAVFLIMFFNTAAGKQLMDTYMSQYNEMLDAYNRFYNQ